MKESCVKVLWVEEWCGTGVGVKVLCISIASDCVCVCQRTMCERVASGKGVCVCVRHLDKGKTSYSCMQRACLANQAMGFRECGRTFPHLQIYNIVPSLGAY